MTAITDEVARLKLDEAEAFLSIVVHRDGKGDRVPTLTICADDVASEYAAEIRVHLRAIFDTLHKAYAAKDAGGA